MDTPSRHVAIAATRFQGSKKGTPVELIEQLNALFNLPATQPEPEVTWVIDPDQAAKNQLGHVVIPPLCERKVRVAVTGSKRNGVKKVPVYYRKNRDEVKACLKAAEAHLAHEKPVHSPILVLKQGQNASC